SGGKYLRAFGSKGKEPGSFTTCHGLAYDDRYEPPRLLVCDRDNRRLQHFTLEGEFLSLYGPELRRPCAAAIRGDIVALAEIEGAVALLDPEGNLVARIGDNPDQTQWANPKVALVDMLAGKYTTPHGLCWDNEGGLLVSEWNRAGRVVKMVQR
ncbi:MAG: 6-bladed beta-propeller, partial [Verrucomicrobiota bacterium]